MATVAPGELGPEYQSVLPPISQVDEVFTRLFTTYPKLNEYANETAAALCGNVLETLQERGQRASPETQSLLEFGTKKLLFVFTDPENLEDTMSDDDFSGIAAILYDRAGQDIHHLAVALDDYANVAVSTYRRLRDGVAKRFWGNLSHHEKFWMVCGAIFENMQPPPAQRAPS